jgi:hypothetical protein
VGRSSQHVGAKDDSAPAKYWYRLNSPDIRSGTTFASLVLKAFKKFADFGRNKGDIKKAFIYVISDALLVTEPKHTWPSSDEKRGHRMQALAFVFEKILDASARGGNKTSDDNIARAAEQAFDRYFTSETALLPIQSLLLDGEAEKDARCEGNQGFAQEYNDTMQKVYNRV